MLAGLLLSALLLGLTGGVHCAAMCGGMCAALNPSPRTPNRQRTQIWALYGLHAGRMLSYASLGALAGGLVQGLAWAYTHAALFKPAWALLHAGILSWGLTLLVFARPPAWWRSVTTPAWQAIRWAAQSPGRSVLLGIGWGVLPCGLLYSALMLAGLSGGPGQGALVMLVFAAPTVGWLTAWRWLSHRWIPQPWLQRLAGLMLTTAALWALWLHATQPATIIC
jgi:uncharacterized protein